MKPIIGLEIHIQLKTKRKMFCDCKNDPEEKLPNINICPICLGHPGTLPYPNKKAIEMVLKVGRALNCRFHFLSKFDRKNYFYPDLPKGYQISQYDLPLCFQGFLKIGAKKIRIRRIHLEEDTARAIHFKDKSLIDFNRAGIPLMELVTEPDLESSLEAKKFCQELQLILRYLGVSEASMEKGQMRCEVNISLKPETKKEASKFKVSNYKVEIKNLNSFKAVEEAIEYEIKRQKEAIEKRKKLVQETRGWDAKLKKTFSQRFKETEADYRYFPEPDLPFIDLNNFELERIFSEIGELPQLKRERFKKEYPKLTSQEIEILVKEKEGADFFEAAVSEAKLILKKANSLEIEKTVFNLIFPHLKTLIEEAKGSFKELNLKPKELGKLAASLYQNQIDSFIAKRILKKMFHLEGDFEDLISQELSSKISDDTQIYNLAQKIIKENQAAVNDFLSGKEKALNFLVGKMMAETKGKIDPKKAQEVFKKIIQK